MTTGKEEAAINAGPTSSSEDLPEDPEQLKKLLCAARLALKNAMRRNEQFEQDSISLAMNALAGRSLNVTTFLAEPHGQIIRCSDPTGMCSEDDLSGDVYTSVFNRLCDPRDHYTSSSGNEDTGLDRIPRLFSTEFRDELERVMNSESAAHGRAKRRALEPIFSRKDIAVFLSPAKGPIDVMLGVDYVRDSVGKEWVHVSLLDIDAVSCCPLTGLQLRKALMRSLSRSVAECQRALHKGAPYTPVSVVRFDGDGLKRVNDAHGHHAGDQVIQAIARRAGQCLLRRNDLLAREGGDEFTLEMRGELEMAEQTGERIRQAIERKPLMIQVQPNDPQKVFLPMTVSVGVATFEEGVESAEDLLARADQALYLSKEKGRNRVSTLRMKALKR